MSETKQFSYVRPTVNTPFNIDFEWWKNHDSNWKIYLREFLCDDHKDSFADADFDVMIDWVDPETAEVIVMDGLQQVLISHCAKQDDFITEHTTLVNAVFRIFLSNGNTPLTPNELSEAVHKSPITILKTLSGPRVYKGIRPCQK
jgi:hypothetical protein